MTGNMRENYQEYPDHNNKYTSEYSIKAISSSSVVTTNGHGHTDGRLNGYGNGVVSDPRSLFHGHDRQEVARLLIQGLQDLGYNESADALVRESGYELESPAAAAFRQSVLDGEWSEAESLLLGSTNSNGPHLTNGHFSYQNGFPLADGVDEYDLRFQLRRQKYLELLEAREHAGALIVLRQELTPLHRDTGQLHNLAGLMACPTAEDLRTQAVWDGAYGSSRQTLLTQLSKAISPSVMIPNHRLATLLTQVKHAQVARCHYHNPISKLSLFTDHACDKDQSPLRTMQELNHTAEVWCLQFSHDGTQLATAGQMNEITIFETQSFKRERVLIGHTDFVAWIVWSPDDTKIVSCSNDRTARIWDVKSGVLLHTINSHGQPVTTVAWTPDGRYFVTGSLDHDSNLYQWTANAEPVFNWSNEYRTNFLAISPDGKRMVVLSADSKIHVYNFATKEEEYIIKLNKDLTCISITRDSEYMLVNMTDDELQLIDINTGEVIERYLGQKQSEFSIRSTFGGADETLVITGSEDGKVYVFNKERGTLIEKLVGHSGCVNTVAWNPTQACMFASAGDDHKVRIWMKPSYGSSSRHQPLSLTAAKKH